MVYITLNKVLEIYQRIMTQSGGMVGVLNLGTLESALAQPRMTFGGTDLYPTIIEKAAALGFSVVKNHPFVDGNKRTGHAVMEMFLVLNGYVIEATVDEQVSILVSCSRKSRAAGIYGLVTSSCSCGLACTPAWNWSQMSTLTVEETRVKDLLKQAVVELFQERKDLFSDLKTWPWFKLSRKAKRHPQSPKKFVTIAPF
jgi:death-on-curing protein